MSFINLIGIAASMLTAISFIPQLVKLLKEKKWLILRKFNKCFRYIDDLLTINNDNFMEKWKTKIYPSELSLISDDKSDQGVNFLDLHLEIKNQVLSYSLLIKGITLIPIVNFPNLNGNIPTSQAYNVYFPVDSLR